MNILKAFMVVLLSISASSNARASEKVELDSEQYTFFTKLIGLVRLSQSGSVVRISNEVHNKQLVPMFSELKIVNNVKNDLMGFKLPQHPAQSIFFNITIDGVGVTTAMKKGFYNILSKKNEIFFLGLMKIFKAAPGKILMSAPGSASKLIVLDKITSVKVRFDTNGNVSEFEFPQYITHTNTGFSGISIDGQPVIPADIHCKQNLL